MADKTIGELPGVTSLDSDSLFVAQQQGTASKVTGAQLIQFANVETAAQVAAAQAAAEAAEESETAAEASKQAAQTAAAQYPYIGENGNWYVFSLATGQFVDSGMAAQGPAGPTGPAGGVNSFNGRTGDVMPQTGDYTAEMVGAAQQVAKEQTNQTTSTKGWYRLMRFKDFYMAANTTFLINIGHQYYATGPGNVTCLLVVDGYAPKITILQSIGNHNQYTIQDIRLVLVSTTKNRAAYALDVYYGFDSTNALAVTYTPINKYAIGLRNRISLVEEAEKVDILPEGETAIAYAEWVSPPMLPGVEYRIAERYNGKPVYTKLVDCGAMPNNTVKAIEYTDDVNARPISVTGIWDGGNATMPGETGSSGFPAQLQNISLLNRNILISTHSDRSSSTASATVKYWKTTD